MSKTQRNKKYDDEKSASLLASCHPPLRVLLSPKRAASRKAHRPQRIHLLYGGHPAHSLPRLSRRRERRNPPNRSRRRPSRILHAATIYDAHGHWIIPGFISAHSHLWQSAYRGLASDQTLLGWIDALYGNAVTQATAEDLYWFTLEGAVDHLRHGITAAYSFNYGGHSRDQSVAFNEQAFRAESDSGIRFVHGWEPGRSSPTYSTEVAAHELDTFLTYTRTHASPHLLSVMINGMTSFDGTPNRPLSKPPSCRNSISAIKATTSSNPKPKSPTASSFKWFTDGGLVTDKLIFGHFIHTDPAILAATA